MSRSLYGRLARRFAPERFTVSRRELLKATLAASAGLLLSDCRTADPRFIARPVGKRVFIVGAGFAGLAAAHELAAVGYDVVVFEARNRVGGRVLSFNDMIEGKIVEGGGELIGSNHPAWIRYARQFGLTFRDIPHDKDLESPLMLAGRKLTKDQAKQVFEEMDRALNSLNATARGVDEDQPWKTPDAANLDSATVGQWLSAVQVSPLAKRAIRAELEGNQAVPLEKQSFLAFLTMIKGGGVERYWTDSETWHCAEGNQMLAAKFVQHLWPHKVMLAAPVASVSYGQTGVVVATQDGLQHRADSVIVTVPPPLWKTIHFTPKLPRELDVQMGVAVKHLSAVKRPFWLDGKFSPESLTDGDISMTWEGTAGAAEGGASELTCFSGGPAAEHARSRPPNERREFFATEIDRLYPGYTGNVDSTRFMDWPADPNTLGGYSFAGPRQITTAGPMLLAGLPPLYFAGEHTCFKFCGYMEGALNSGAMAARRLAIHDGVARPSASGELRRVPPELRP